MGHEVARVEETDLEVVPYDSSWPRLFEKEADDIQKALGSMAAALEHFGSTSVPGLAAKPIVDILVGTSQANPPTVRHLEHLTSLGYEYLGEDGRRPGRYFFRKRGETSFNVSIVPLKSELWHENLMVRDYLRSCPDEVRLYAAVKQEGIKASPDSLLAYQNYKRAYMEEMKQRARRYFGR